MLQNKKLRGLAGPKSKIVTLTGEGRAQLIKDLRDVQKKMGDPQLILLTTEYKVNMIKTVVSEWDDSSNSWVSNPIDANSKIARMFIDYVDAWDLRRGPTLPKDSIESAVSSGYLIGGRLKNSLDKASLDDDIEYHAVVILPDPENLSKNQQQRSKAINNN